MQYKEDLEEFERIIKKHSITTLYHCTNYDNLPSIISHDGLYSRSYCKHNDIQISTPGGNELSQDLDSSKRLDDYVRLSFNLRHPMFYLRKRQIQKIVSLRVDPSVIYWQSTLFSNKNATQTGVVVGGHINDFKSINFDLAKEEYDYCRHSDMDKQYIQAEVMVKKHIPLKYITFPESISLKDITSP